jgi:D-alanine-D-alanine ligase-like ATP-grasp enzyme
MFESVIATKICGDKYLTSLLLREAGIPVPECESFSPFETDRALSHFSSAKTKLVVKPQRSTSGGAGVTTEIEGRRDFLRAFALAASFGKEVLVEEFVPGMNFRFLVFQGKVLSIVYRDRLHVIGDGSRTVDNLVDTDLHYNIGRPRPPRSRVLDNDALQHLRSKNVALSYVPKSGEKVYLKQMCNSGPIAEVRCEASRSISEAALAAARVTGAKFCAVDIIAEGDICSQEAQRFYVNEVNTSPALFNNKEPRPDGSPDTSCTEVVLASLFPASRVAGEGTR